MAVMPSTLPPCRSVCGDSIGLGETALQKVSLKSQEGVYARLHAQLIRSDPLETSTSKRRSLTKDLETLQSRFLSEGLSFLTKTLPSLGKAFDQALESGRLNVPREFGRAHANASIPAFLQAYFSLVFDEDGFLLGTVPVPAVKHIRQVLYFAYKLEVPYSDTETSRVIERFIQTDEELELCDSPLASTLLGLAKIITGKVFHGFDHKTIHPQHGPGAVATGEKTDAKWRFSRLYRAIHQVYPYYDYYVVGGARELADRLDWYRSLQRLESGCAKVVLVPKDSRGPRLISCEPLEYQWIQQGLGRKLAHFLERTSPYTRGHVNFTHQEINGKLALTSSASRRFATLDLKDASDRVSLGVVRSVFQRVPGLLRALEASRTTETKLPDGRVITLKKFAPMGSALCFPTEAYVFWVLIVSAVVHGKNLPLEHVGKRIFIYGDDIVVPTEWAALSIQALEEVGLLVNLDKSCIQGNFRESCGVEAFNGVDITPSRLRKLWSGRKSDGAALLSYTALANQIAPEYKSVSDLLWEEIEKVYGAMPYGTSRASYPCRITPSTVIASYLNGQTFRHRWNSDYQQVEYKVLRPLSRSQPSFLDGWLRLMRDLVSPPFSDPSRIVLSRSMSIKRGWARVA